jgi:hypothetical protein
MIQKIGLLLCVFLTACAQVSKKEQSPSSPLEAGKKALHQMTGCYLVDYSYVETDPLKKGYVRDPRVYDVNKNKSVKEWIYAEDLSPTRVRLQHILFATDEKGALMEGSILKHQAEDWEFNAPFVYDFTAPSQWEVKRQSPDASLWTRRITNLDDGLRYQCAASWDSSNEYSQWTCEGAAPIPGRETRDMGRKDYNVLQRSTHLVVYDNSWLERQNNVKVNQTAAKKTPLVKEVGKNWYVRLPQEQCQGVQEFVAARRPFWDLLRESWDQVYAQELPFHEVKKKPSRYAKISDLEESSLGKNLADKKVRAELQDEILKVISDFRVQ